MQGLGGLGYRSLATGVELDKVSGRAILPSPPAPEGIVGLPGCVNLPSNEMGGKGVHIIASYFGCIGCIVKHKAPRFGVSPVREIRLVLVGAVNGGGGVPVVGHFAVQAFGIPFVGGGSKMCGSESHSSSV